MPTEYIAGPLPLAHWSRIRARLAAIYSQKLGHLTRDLTREHVSVDSGQQHLQKRENLREAATGTLIDLETILSVQLQLSLELDNAQVTSDIRAFELELGMQKQLEVLLTQHVENLPHRAESETRLRHALEQYASLRTGSTEAVLQERHLLRQVQHDIPVLGAEDVELFLRRLVDTRQQIDTLEVALLQLNSETQLQFAVPVIYATLLAEVGVPLTPVEPEPIEAAAPQPTPVPLPTLPDPEPVPVAEPTPVAPALTPAPVEAVEASAQAPA